MASVPTLESLAMKLDYFNKLDIIEQTDFSKDIKENPQVIDQLAKSKCMSVQEYKKQEGRKLKKIEIRELQEQYKHYFVFENDEGDDEDFTISPEKLREQFMKRMSKVREKDPFVGASKLFVNPLDKSKSDKSETSN